MQRAEAIRRLSAGINKSISLGEALRETERPLQPEPVLDPDKERLVGLYTLRHNRANGNFNASDVYGVRPKHPAVYLRSKDWISQVVVDVPRNGNSDEFPFSAEPITESMKQELYDANGGLPWPAKVMHFMPRSQLKQLIRRYSKIG